MRWVTSREVSVLFVFFVENVQPGQDHTDTDDGWFCEGPRNRAAENRWEAASMEYV